MSCPTSPSDGEGGSAGASRAFEQLHPTVQRWIWKRNWSELRDAQEAAIPLVLAGDRDVLISAATAAGKTEAAFLPIVSTLAGLGEDAGEGIRALYVAPLKALINDQFRRVEELCEALTIPVARWHGDVAATRKRAVLKTPSGILLITPESLEAVFVNHGTKIARIFHPLGHMVIDELHAFIGQERGRQLQSLLARLECAIKRRVQRIGLSATLGDMTIAADYLRPGEAETAALITSASGGQEIRLQVRGYRVSEPDAEATGEDAGQNAGGFIDVAEQLFQLRGTDNLVFCNTRSDVERYSDRLRILCDTRPGRGEFLPHHGSLSKGIREEIELRLKRDGDVPITVLCTTTLEMGIDIGNVSSVAQIGPPPSVASLRQRLGRSGRRGEAAVLRIHVQEEEVSPLTSPLDAIRPGLVQAIAMIQLLLSGWCEPPDRGALHLSTLIQQVLSLIAQRGGVTAGEAHDVLCVSGPFQNVTADQFRQVLRCMGDRDLVTQLQDRTLTLGLTGERVVNHYSFYVVFPTTEEYRVVSGSALLGQILFDRLLVAGQFIIFAGKRWLIESVDPEGKIVFVSPRASGRVPRFAGGAGALVHERVRQEMKSLYLDSEIPRYLDSRAAELLQEGRQNFLRLELDTADFVADGNDCLWFPWIGDKALDTLGMLLCGASTRNSRQGPALHVDGTTVDALRVIVRELQAMPLPTALDLAGAAKNAPAQKYEHFLDQVLLAAEHSHSRIDLEGAARALATCARESDGNDG